MSIKNKLKKMSVQELFDYQQQQLEIYQKLKFEVDNWVSTQEMIKASLAEKRDELVKLEEDAKRDRLRTQESHFDAINNLH